MVTHEYLQITIKMIPIFHYQTTKITENKLLRQFILQYNPKQNKQRLSTSLMYGKKRLWCFWNTFFLSLHQTIEIKNTFDFTKIHDCKN